MISLLMMYFDEFKNNLINKKETIDSNPTALEVKNKRINRMLKQINENDVIIKNNKQKPKEFTSTPSGIRRRTLRAPNNVSIINDISIINDKWKF